MNKEKDNLLELLDKMWECGGDCPYGLFTDCEDCIQRMVAEHDAEVRKQTIYEFVKEANNYEYKIGKEDRSKIVLEFIGFIAKQLDGGADGKHNC